jgi:hypothetical protein
MSRIMTIALRTAVASGVLLGAGFVGATEASAASPSRYACTATYPEVCVGVYTTFGVIYSEQVQGNFDHGTWYQYIVSQSNGDETKTGDYFNESSGWGVARQFPDSGFGRVCVWVRYGRSQDNMPYWSAKACA